MDLRIDKDSEQPIYEQIRKQIVQLVRDGLLPPGSKIPSVRQLALKLGVGKNTVSQAYDELSAESIIETRHGSGTYITDSPGIAIEHNLRSQKENGNGEAGQKMRWDPYNFRSEFFGLPRSPRDEELIDFTRATPDPELFPFERIKQVSANMLWYPKEFFFDVGHPQGYQPLVEHLEKQMALSGVAMAEGENDIIITAGFRRALDLILGFILQPGQKVAIEAPSYSGLLNVLIAKRVGIEPVPMDSEGMDTAYLEGLVRRGEISAVITIPTYHNPTGITMSQARREHLLEIAARYNLPIIEDDWGRELRYEGVAPPPLKAMDTGGHVIHIGTYSKVFLPGMRIGWMTIPSEIAVPQLRAKLGLDSGDSFFLQSLLHEFIIKGHFAKHVRKTLKEYKKRRNLMVDALNAHLPEGCSFVEPQGGFCIWLNLPENIMSLPLLGLARKADVDFTPANLMMPDRKDRNGLRLSFSRVRIEDIEEGIKALCSVIGDCIDNPALLQGSAHEYEDLFQ
ncbi:MAG: PLP-dependent aminotransferase family protein [bacterium]